MSIGTMVIELREFNDKKKKKKKKKNTMDKMQKLNFVIIWSKSGNLMKYLVHRLLFVLCCQIIKSQIDLKLKARSEFPNVWGEHSNPYIQGTTVPCDIIYTSQARQIHVHVHYIRSTSVCQRQVKEWFTTVYMCCGLWLQRYLSL